MLEAIPEWKVSRPEINGMTVKMSCSRGGGAECHSPGAKEGHPQVCGAEAATRGRSAAHQLVMEPYCKVE